MFLHWHLSIWVWNDYNFRWWYLFLFLGFCCHLWVLGGHRGCRLPGKECVRDPARCVHWGFQVECFSGYWELTFRNGDGIGGIEDGRCPRERGKMDLLSLWICLVPGGEEGGRKAHCKWSATELRMRLENWIWRRRGRVNIWRSPTCFSCLSESVLVSGFSGNSYWSLQLEQRYEGGHDKGCQRSRVFSWSTWILEFFRISVKNGVGIFIVVVLNLQNDFGLVIIFTILILPIFECGTSFHFLGSSWLFFLRELKCSL